MASDSFRVRFAPSPTGNPHVGNFRTALYNYLLARHNGGQFLLRIEDTDKERSKKEYETAILDSLRWMGMEWDEDPVYQSHRIERHKEEALRLLDAGLAYRCRCTPERLDALRKEQQDAGKTPMYDGCCRDANHEDDGTPYCVRLKTPQEGFTKINDPIRGDVEVSNHEVDDIIMVRSDGTPVYNFAVVVDDHDMNITHVIRGDDHLNNTIKQVQIYQSLGYDLPIFAHLPQILGQDKARLSKRHGATGVMEYRDQGYLPEAIMNYLARLGWGHGDQELFSKQELVDLFSLDACNKSAAVFDPKKLEWINAEQIKLLPVEELGRRFVEYALAKGTLTQDQCDDVEFINKIASCTRERIHTLDEIYDKISFVYQDEYVYPEKESRKAFKPEAMTAVGDLAVYAAEHSGETLSHEDWENAFKDIMEKREIKMRPFAQAVRLALTGSKVSPPIFDVIGLLGNQKVAERLNSAIEFAKTIERD